MKKNGGGKKKINRVQIKKKPFPPPFPPWGGKGPKNKVFKKKNRKKKHFGKSHVNDAVDKGQIITLKWNICSFLGWKKYWLPTGENRL